MKKLLSLMIIFLMTFNVHAQDQHLVDSLDALLKTAKQDTTRVNILYKLSRTYKGKNPDKALDFAKQTLALAEQIGYKKGVVKAYNCMGYINQDIGDYLHALDLHKKALEISEKIGYKQGIAGSAVGIGLTYSILGNYTESLKNYSAALQIFEKIGDKQGISDSYNNIGNIYADQGNYPEALKNYSASSKIKEEIGDKKGIAGTYNNIGLIYANHGNYSEALKNYFTALKIKEEIGDKKGIAGTYNNIGNVYSNQSNYPEALKNYFASLKLFKEIGEKNVIAESYNNIGNIYADQGNYPEALETYFTSLKIFEEIGDKHGIAESYHNIGIIYIDRRNYSAALEKLLAALKIMEELGNKDDIALAYTNIGDVYTKQKKYNDASQYLDKALSLSKEIRNLNYICSSYYYLVQLDSAQGNFKQALEYYKMYITTRDSLVNIENTRKTVQQQMQYEFDKRESLVKAEQEKKDVIAQKELQKQKWVRNGFIGGFAAVLLFAGVFYRQRIRISKEKKISDTEKKRSEELLLNILPYEVAEELKTTGTAKAKTYSMVSVMFTDFKDFTRVSSKVSAELLVGEIHHCYSAFDTILENHKIEKIKTIGDAYMCASGLPVLNYSHAEDLVNAAIEILNFMQVRKKEKEAKGETPFELRIGIHTGPVVAGIVGIKKFAYDIWGDTVNIAARMEQNSEAGKINISGSTYELVKDKFNCIHRGKIEAKNKGEVEMYFVESMT